MAHCLGCSKFYLLKPSKSKYCSISCANKGRLGSTKKELRECPECKQPFNSNHRKFCSTQCSNKSRTGSTRTMSDEFREMARVNINKRYEDGWSPKAGRCKKFNYKSLIAGTIQLDGTWELKAAEYFDSQHYNWRRNVERFPYICPKGKARFYTPDFWVEELGGYIEVKGYETELDRFKWNPFHTS